MRGGQERRRRQRRLRPRVLDAALRRFAAVIVVDALRFDFARSPAFFDDCHPDPSFNTRISTRSTTVACRPAAAVGRIGGDEAGFDRGRRRCASTAVGTATTPQRSSSSSSSSSFELIVAHFLGVDHVGHTYGPNDPHMERKLHQMDVVLSEIFGMIDDAPGDSCVVAFVLGDHGMTEDGNHGGGTSDEVNAGLFAHYSPGCGDGTAGDDGKTTSARGEELDVHSARAMRELKEILDSASLVYRDAISQSRRHLEENGDSHGEDVFDSTAYRQACALFKLFLAESTDLGKQVWTQFNEGGMKVGIGVMVVAWVMAIPLWRGSVRNEFFGKIWVDGVIKSMQNDKDRSNASSWHFSWVELTTSITIMTFTCGVLTFSNSYIEHEREIVAFFLSVLCLLAFRRWYFATPAGSKSYIGSIYPPLVVVLCSRTNDVFVTGHGLDPSIRLHPAHHPAVFLSSLLVLTILRIRWLGSLSKTIERSGITSTPLSTSIDIIAILFLACSWWDKRSLDHSRTGFVSARIALAAIFWGFVHSILSLSKQWKYSSPHGHTDTISESRVDQAHLTLFRAMLFLVIVTGPSMASTAVLIIIQCVALRRMMDSTRAKEVSAPAMAAIWRLAIRQAFFASNHHCSFNRLQFSAAFVATNSFQFYIAGSSLFMNTFGYELLGSCVVLVYCHSRRASSRNYSADVWEWFVYFQWTEMLCLLPVCKCDEAASHGLGNLCP
ncbi:hypothetical protein ACHAW5_003673 [Stephanodiscus triporus]|uniref:GPI ethanolamine phosphate transferase 3 n=1 Tax=Stephanodiscus triporus TaxID=2934178 RepID=A0ABD3NFE4_9STRA